MVQYTVKLISDPENGGFTAQCIELPGAISEGDTKEEALSNITEAILLVLEELQTIDNATQEVVKVEVCV